jgi:hypothetical protein
MLLINIMASLVWSNPPSKKSVLLRKSTGDSVLLQRGDCINFTKGEESVLAKILGFGFSGQNAEPFRIFYTPYRISESRWSSPVLRQRNIQESDELNSIEKVECPPGNSGYTNNYKGGKTKRLRYSTRRSRKN